MKKVLLTLALLSTIFPIFVQYTLAQGPVLAPGDQIGYEGLVDCDGVLKDRSIEPGRQQECDFIALMRTVNKLINWVFVISIPIATVLFAWGGLLYLRGTSGSRSQANKIFTSVAIGFIIMLVAWISVRTVVEWFVEKDSGAMIFLGK